jgi:hypothetical protein
MSKSRTIAGNLGTTSGEGGGGVTVYDSAGLLPTSGNTPGDFGWATNKKALYTWDGAEWDRVYSGPNETLTWDTTLSATTYIAPGDSATLTVAAAADFEGFPVTYSYQVIPSNPIGLDSASGTDNSGVINNGDGTFNLYGAQGLDSDASFTFRAKATDGTHVITSSTNVSISGSEILNILSDNSCVALYKLDSDGTDVSGNYDATGYITGSGGYYPVAKYGSASFSPSLSSAVLDLPDVVTTYPFTVSAWVRPLNIDNGGNNVVVNTSIGAQRVTIAMYDWNGSNNFQPVIMYGGTNHWYFTGQTFAVNTWYHIVWSVVGSNNASHVVYVNGSALTANNGGSTHGGAAGWSLGGNTSGAEKYEGYLDNVRIFNKALSASEAATLYSRGG